MDRYEKMENRFYKSYEIVRARVVHEDNLVNHRITWLITLNGLLFASFGVSLGETPEELRLLAERLRVGLYFAGVGSAVSACLGIAAAFISMRQDRIDFYQYHGRVKAEMSELWTPRFRDHRDTNTLGMASGMLVPLIVGAAWFFISFEWITDAESYLLYLSWGLVALAAAVWFYCVVSLIPSLNRSKYKIEP